MKSIRSSRTFSEALIVIVVVAGFFWLISQGKFEVQDAWLYFSFLAMIVVFYFALLLCHMIFFHMVGGNGTYPWWEHTEHYDKYLEKSKKIGKK